MTIASKPVAPAMASPPGPLASVAIRTANGLSSASLESWAPGEHGAPFTAGAGAAKTAAPASLPALAAESAAKVGAVEGAEKPPSDDIAREERGRDTHQINSRATADNLENGVSEWGPAKARPKGFPIVVIARSPRRQNRQPTARGTRLLARTSRATDARAHGLNVSVSV